ncbi:NAD-dependent epimerase/dehydratase family protein [Serratia symbiotica]|uniref:NAD(P)-dependent oxidoreductase n=1 Tax=Serratia symbiotica TaxID=138074 RepID=A0A068Z3J1_9GAMM|nr:NAD(P)-dependent oxidoreductase [Serratia symbiotica]MBF1994700.1 NAD(P)-dependent oxidoreductase [Serratia symbiotica]MBQ0955468.1 NAD(P)-dependent oxidoreductase [Serratia symbiotica]QLH61776.1 NAD(P)-dependent oxidoreductase [Serratia symbiotica]QTP14727.1 NAD(P)-dependent oxidoreductase [Serratia symbiotica]CDS56752.1 NAD-dependent epimerase/dehydratase [Serratia symbiotica]
MTLRNELGRILITGAGGRVATAFRHAVGHRYRLRLAERDSGLLNDVHPDDEVISFNIADLDACRTACADIDTVLHLSADPSPNVDFCGSLIDNNILGTFNIFRAAKDAGCRRVVFASSAQVVEGYPLDYQIRPDDVPKPKNLYGASKAFGEGIAAYFAHQEGLSSLSVRIALLTTLADGEPLSARDMSVFLSHRDATDLLERCIRIEGVQHAVVHGISNNRYKRLSLVETSRLLGYYPQDDAFSIRGFA